MPLSRTFHPQSRGGRGRSGMPLVLALRIPLWRRSSSLKTPPVLRSPIVPDNQHVLYQSPDFELVATEWCCYHKGAPTEQADGQDKLHDMHHGVAHPSASSMRPIRFSAFRHLRRVKLGSVQTPRWRLTTVLAATNSTPLANAYQLSFGQRFCKRSDPIKAPTTQAAQPFTKPECALSLHRRQGEARTIQTAPLPAAHARAHHFANARFFYSPERLTGRYTG